MKSVFVLFVLTAFVAVSLAQDNPKDKGEQCQFDSECIRDHRNFRCVENYCGCEEGKRQEQESHPGNSHVFVCTKVIDLGCARNEDCSVDLANSKCEDKRCVCKKEDGCNGASTLAIISFIPMVLLTLGVIKQGY